MAQKIISKKALASMLKRREAIAQKFISGEWGVELFGFEEGRAQDREASQASVEQRQK